MTTARNWTPASALTAIVALVCVALVGAQPGADDVQKIAAALKMGDSVKARKLAEGYAKKADGVEEAMDLLTEKNALPQGRGYTAAAVGLIAEVMAPKKDVGRKSRNEWISSAINMQQAGIALENAKMPGDIKAAATRLNKACVACHAEWRK